MRKWFHILSFVCLLSLLSATPSSALVDVVSRSEFLEAVRSGRAFTVVSVVNQAAGMSAFTKFVNPAGSGKTALLFSEFLTVRDATSVIQLGHASTVGAITTGINLRTGGLSTTLGITSGSQVASPLTDLMAQIEIITFSPIEVFSCCIEVAPGDAVAIFNVTQNAGIRVNWLWIERNQ